MAAKKQSKPMLTSGQKVGIGVGVTAATLAAVGGYFLYGAKDASKNRKQVKSWALKAKAEVLEGIEKAKHLSQEDYDKLIDDVMKGYKAARSASVKELGDFAADMKKHWKHIEKTGKPKIAASKKKAKTTKAKSAK